MTRAERLQPVQDLVEDTQRRLAASLATAEQQLSESETKLRELERYRGEYERQFSQSAGQGIGAMALRDYQAFLARLGEAIRQQQALVQRMRCDRDAERRRWQDAAKRAKALGHVVEQWRTEARRTAERSEQRETDERAQRKATRP